MSESIWTKGFDEVVEMFDNYRAADKRLNRLADELASICIRETARFSPDPHGSGGEDVPELQRYVEQREEKRDRLLEQLKRVSEQFDAVIQTTNQLKGSERDVVQRYYIIGHPMHRVAQDLNYSVRQCWNIRDAAFYHLAQGLHNCAQ